MRYGISLLALLCALSIGTAQVDAQGRGKGQAKRPTTAGAKQGGGKVDRPATPKATGTTKTTTKASPTTGTEARVKGNPHKTTTPTGTVTADTPTTTHVKNPRLEARLQPMLPAGMTVQDASQGFKNWGQFVAAVHVSNNLGLDFNAVKAAMTGIPAGSPVGTAPTTTPMSLGQAIQSVKGTMTTDPATIRTEVKKAEDAANTDLRRTRGRS